MIRNPIAQVFFAVVLSLPLHAAATCTAANPNGALSEATPSSAFVDHGDGTVTHNLTGLMWKRCPQGLSGAACTTGTPTGMTWKAALAAAVSDITAGFTDWRVPNKKELESIVESCGFNPAVNTVVFPATPWTNNHWTSSTANSVSTLAWTVAFSLSADSTISPKSTATNVVRLVRKGNSVSSFDAAFPGHGDVDGNGTADPLTDGLLLIRYMFGLRGTALIQSAIGPGAQRTTALEIESHLQSILPKQ